MKKEIIFLSTPEEVSMADEWFEIAKADHFWMEWRFAIIKQGLKKTKAPSPTMKFLEIGCGHGEFLKQSDALLNAVTDGCDLNLYALNRITNVKGNVYVYNILELNPKMVGTYNGIFLLDVIEHIDNDEEFLNAALSHLTIDGFVVINVPALSSLFSKYDVVAGHKRRYSKKSLKELFEKCGVETIQIQYWGFSLLFVAIIRKIYLKFVPSKNVIKKGFNPANVYVNKIFKMLMKVELFFTSNPVIGTSLVAIGKRKSILRNA